MAWKGPRGRDNQKHYVHGTIFIFCQSQLHDQTTQGQFSVTRQCPCLS